MQFADGSLPVVDREAHNDGVHAALLSSGYGPASLPPNQGRSRGGERLLLQPHGFEGFGVVPKNSKAMIVSSRKV
jgi:hypothetical protein